jgi:hypothetical protein
MRAFIIALVWPAATVLAAQCYFPNGDAVNSDTGMKKKEGKASMIASMILTTGSL